MKNPAAFALRYPQNTAPVYGPYLGFLDNAGERLELKDSVGETIFNFEYNDDWDPLTDGSGRSLVIRDPLLPQVGLLDQPATWGISADSLGAPGKASSQVVEAYQGWDNLHFTPVERGNPLISGPFADHDGDGRVNWVEYAMGTDPWTPDAAPVELLFVKHVNKPYAALRFTPPAP